MAKYRIIREWDRSYKQYFYFAYKIQPYFFGIFSTKEYITSTIGYSAEECERKLRQSLDRRNEIVKELEI